MMLRLALILVASCAPAQATQIGSGMTATYKGITANYTINAIDHFLARTNTAVITITAPVVNAASEFIIKDEGNSANAIVFKPSSGTVDGAGADTIGAAYGAKCYYFNGTNYFKWSTQ